ncbi:unnamed protein product, partial [Mesorhabditis spiculigera]
MDTPAQRCAKCPRRVEDFGMQLEGAMILGRNGARAACEELRGEANIQRCQDQVVKAMKIGVEIVQRMFPREINRTRSGSPALRTWSCVQCEQSLDLLKDLFGRHLLAFNTIIPEWLCQKGDITVRQKTSVMRTYDAYGEGPPDLLASSARPQRPDRPRQHQNPS